MCISCFCFFASGLLLAVYILDYGNNTKTKSNLSDFLKFKMGCKATETTHNSTFGPGTPNERTAHGGLRSFAKEERALKMRSAVASHQKLTTTNREPSLKLIHLQEKLPRNSTSTILWSFSI
ncbi:unnamed protein product [Rangifer tarandus platyrhynchus]|uniref:Uncharacterized protein n=2 Tax=Rangifer tarandus platyrhynchus TaxID=3082113 RepID=A0ABN8ZVS9_RANTA|nr:unnamed protein product [Rangifer tarandus platyrhynchus]